MLAGSRVLNRSGGSMMWQSPETRNSLYVAIGRPLLERLPGYQIVGLQCINIDRNTADGQRLIPVTAWASRYQPRSADGKGQRAHPVQRNRDRRISRPVGVRCENRASDESAAWRVRVARRPH